MRMAGLQDWKILPWSLHAVLELDEKQMCKDGDSLESLTAFLLFLKIEIKTVIPATLLCSWLCSQVILLARKSLKDWSTVQVNWPFQDHGSWSVLLSSVRGGLFSELPRRCSPHTWLFLHLKFHHHYIQRNF